MFFLNDLYSLKNKVEAELKEVISTLGEKTSLRDACEYSLLSGGKRVRPIIVLMIGEALGGVYEVMPVALAMEFFHTASIIADDLPCMDNDEHRRNKPTLHKVFDESVALLSSYTLISLGYEYIHKNTLLLPKDVEPEKICVSALEIVTKSAGIFGATNGQFIDLFPPDHTIETIEKIIYQKTITLFEMSFCLGWLFGGGDSQKMEDVKRLAYHLGMAFQIGDDLGDVSQDESRSCEINIATLLGKDKALERYHLELASFREMLKKLSIDTPTLLKFAEFIEKKQLEAV